MSNLVKARYKRFEDMPPEYRAGCDLETKEVKDSFDNFGEFILNMGMTKYSPAGTYRCNYCNREIPEGTDVYCPDRDTWVRLEVVDLDEGSLQ